ncbi:hypothetical protein Pan153_57990 [Gimesia panareensis]|uniref:Uncharacterized protein n=1 Tax=Gimesia panareensis TaxID=2527978 RepID=A0A518FXL7_9PLAN|nr:hypothetical protein Pan153_57990 [Gimesia panareensis]
MSSVNEMCLALYVYECWERLLWSGRVNRDLLLAALGPDCIRAHPFDLSGMALATGNRDPRWRILPAASALPLRVGGRLLITVGRADSETM